MRDQIKVIHPEDTAASYSREQFEKVMGVKWSESLQFSSPKIENRICRLCQKSMDNGKVETKQKWLGIYYEKDMEKTTTLDLAIKWIGKEIGYGVFSEQRIVPGTFIGEYVGVVRKRDKKNVNSYCFSYPIGENNETPFIIDAALLGNHTRYINHSNEKANLEPTSIFYGGRMHIILFAKIPIQRGEELLYDYGPYFWGKSPSSIWEK
ncbi:MAG: SET domain-containing protein-lysine N-methyltransferase [Chlamydiae bacterium]|nr:SET domain-containing protein-lysine N-methyltransferase [Chlamydiota bacterium]